MAERPITVKPLVALLTVLAVAGCGAASEGGETTTTAGDSPTTTLAAPSTTLDDMTEPEMPEVVDQAIADLAELLQIDAEAISVELHENVTWRDGSLGCPVEGRSYTQALVDGHRTVLVAEGERYHFHGASGSNASLCENPQAPASGSGDA